LRAWHYSRASRATGIIESAYDPGSEQNDSLDDVLDAPDAPDTEGIVVDFLQRDHDFTSQIGVSLSMEQVCTVRRFCQRKSVLWTIMAVMSVKEG